MEREPFFETLACQLTESEKHERGQQLAAKHEELLVHQDNMKAASKANKDKEKDLKKDLARLARARHTGVEDREVECYQTPNVAEHRIETIRSDTGEVEFHRPMDPMERQQATQGELPFNSPSISRAIRAARSNDPVHPLRSVPDEPTGGGDDDDGEPGFNPLPPAVETDDEDLPEMDENGEPVE